MEKNKTFGEVKIGDIIYTYYNNSAKVYENIVKQVKTLTMYNDGELIELTVSDGVPMVIGLSTSSQSICSSCVHFLNKNDLKNHLKQKLEELNQQLEELNKN